MVETLDVAAVLVAALMAGNEVAIAAFVHPSLCRLDDRTHARAAQALAKRLGRVMPFWYAATLVLAAAVALTRPAGSTGRWLAGVAAALFAASIVFTVLGPVPINNRIAAWDLSALPEGWLSDRRRWDRLHAIRVAGLLVAVVFLAYATVLGPS